MAVYFSAAARTATQRMPTPQCTQTCKWICFNELDLPATTTEGISGTVAIPALAQPLYWRRMTRRSDWPTGPVTVGSEDPDAADHWVAIYRQMTPDECINYMTPRDSVMVVDFRDNRDVSRMLPSVIG